MDRPSTTTTSLAKNNIGGDSIYSVSSLKLPSSCEESREITEITKDFSVCASTFGHSKAKSISDLVCGQPTEIYGEDEAAKDCL